MAALTQCGCPTHRSQGSHHPSPRALPCSSTDAPVGLRVTVPSAPVRVSVSLPSPSFLQPWQPMRQAAPALTALQFPQAPLSCPLLRAVDGGANFS